MAVINTNVSATIAQNALVKNERMMSKAMEQLSTGKRINSAADDAAGLAISSRMTSQIRGLEQAVRNANDASSMVQTADGAFSEVENMLQRMRELAVQASNGVLGATERGYLNTEYQSLVAEIQRVGGNTQFNGANLLDGTIGTSGSVSFQLGPNAGQTVSATMTTLGATTGSVAQAVTQAAGGGNAQVVTLTLSGTISDLDTVSFTVDGRAGFVTLTTAAGTGVTASSGPTSESAGAITVARTAATTITLTAATADETFSVADIRVSRGISADIAKTDVATASTANTALGSITTALESVNSARASFGAVMNRLEYAADNLSNESANTQAARSAILDADYATATTELARTQIIQQAGTAMLAQANQLPQTVLSLLQ